MGFLLDINNICTLEILLWSIATWGEGFRSPVIKYLDHLGLSSELLPHILVLLILLIPIIYFSQWEEGEGKTLFCPSHIHIFIPKAQYACCSAIDLYSVFAVTGSLASVRLICKFQHSYTTQCQPFSKETP